LRNRIEGEVLMEAIVREDGTIGEIRVMKSVHPDLDAAALGAARQWLFRPATRSGQPIPVVVTLSLSFRIKI
jgi:TonB family protein